MNVRGQCPSTSDGAGKTYKFPQQLGGTPWPLWESYFLDVADGAQMRQSDSTSRGAFPQSSERRRAGQAGRRLRAARPNTTINREVLRTCLLV